MAARTRRRFWTSAAVAMATSGSCPADVATFDTMIEGLLSQTLTIGGITFTNLDQRLGIDQLDRRFAIDDMRSTLAGNPGFTASNCLTFGGYIPGAVGGFFRFGSFDILPARLGVSASIEVFYRGPNPVDLTLNLEAYRAGMPIGIVSVPVSLANGVHHVTLAYAGPAFDRLLVFVGPTDESVVYAVVDGVNVVLQPECAADFNGDASVDPADVASFISAWYGGVLLGTLTGDFNADGAVTPADVALFVGTWLAEATGPCAP